MAEPPEVKFHFKRSSQCAGSKASEHRASLRNDVAQADLSVITGRRVPRCVDCLEGVSTSMTASGGKPDFGIQPTLTL